MIHHHAAVAVIMLHNAILIFLFEEFYPEGLVVVVVCLLSCQIGIQKTTFFLFVMHISPFYFYRKKEGSK
jgi:hypothetical protein